MNYPYDDTNMVYDNTIHGYVLTVEGVRNLLGTDLSTYLDPTGDFNPSTMGARILKMVSQHFYAWVYAHGTNQRFIEWLFAKYPPCRDLIRECLVNEVYYALKNGDFWNYADSEIPFDKAVSESTRLMLDNPLPNGINVLYRGTLPYLISAEKYRADY